MKRTLSLFAFLLAAQAGSAFARTPLDECLKKIKADPTIVKAELKMVTLAPAGSQWAKEFVTWRDDLLQESDCRAEIKWYWNGGGGGDELRMIADLRQGQKHGAAMTAVGLGEIYKEILLLQLPGLFENWPALDQTREAEKAFFEKEFEKRGFVIVGWGDVGAAKMLTVGKEVKTPADLKDLGAFHLPGDAVSPMYYSKVGLKARPVALGELGTHLGKDIQVVNIAPYAAEQLQLASKVTHMTAMTTAYLIGALVVKKDKLDAMPADLKALFLKTGKESGDKLTKTIRLQDAEAFKRLKQSKITYTPTDEELKQWAQSSSDARKALRGAPFNPEIFDRIVKK